MRRAQHLEHLVQTLLADHIAHAHVLCVICGHSNGQVTLSDLEDEVFLLFALDGPDFDRFDQCSTVVWVDNGVSDLENHQIRAPFTLNVSTAESGP